MDLSARSSHLSNGDFQAHFDVFEGEYDLLDAQRSWLHRRHRSEPTYITFSDDLSWTGGRRSVAVAPIYRRLYFFFYFSTKTSDAESAPSQARKASDFSSLRGLMAEAAEAPLGDVPMLHTGELVASNAAAGKVQP